MINLGTSLATAVLPSSQRHTVVITVPHRGYAAALIAHGVVVTRLATIPPLPIRERFAGVEPGTPITWIDSNMNNRYGRFVRIDDRLLHYRQRVHGGWDSTRMSVMLDFASSYWPASNIDEFVSRTPAADNLAFVTAASGLPVDVALSSSDIDTFIVGNRSLLEREFHDPVFSAAADPSAGRGKLVNTVRPRGLVGHGQHHRSAILPATSDPDDLEGSSCHGPAIFDGAGGYIRHRDLVDAPASIAVLDRWEPGSADAAIAAQIDRAQTWLDVPLPRIPPPPPGIEVFRWVGAP